MENFKHNAQEIKDRIEELETIILLKIAKPVSVEQAEEITGENKGTISSWRKGKRKLSYDKIINIAIRMGL